MKDRLTIPSLCDEAMYFAEVESAHFEPLLFGITDGKAVGTYLEHKFQEHLRTKYTYEEGNSARGIDFPELLVDIKVTSVKQPQSSSPFKSAGQKIFGLGYSLLVFVYEKTDDAAASAARLNILHTIFVERSRTGDYQTTSGIRKILQNNGNEDDLIAFMQERMLPVDDVQATEIAQKLLAKAPEIGYLTISNALQWRLQYRRVIELAGEVDGLIRVR
ncbi:MAG: restriction endonuclease [Pseudomonadota bacterium]